MLPAMLSQSLSFMKNVSWLAPLPIPDLYQNLAFRVSGGRQLLIAFMLNILSLAIPVMMLQVYDRIIPHKSFGTLSLLTLGVLIALSLDAALRIIRSWLIGWTAASHEHAANCAALDHFNRSDLKEFSKVSSGEHLQNFGALSRLREFYAGQAMTALIDLPFAILFLGLVAYLGGILVLVPIVLITLFFACAKIISGKLRKALERRHLADDKKSSTMLSILSGIHSVKALGVESSLLRQYEYVQKDVTNESYHVARASGAASTLGATFGQLSLILTATFGCYLVIQGHLSVGGLSACTLLAGRSIQPIQKVLGTWLRLQDLSIAKSQAQNLFALPARDRSDKPMSSHFSGNITLDKVSFDYGASGKPLLKNISIDIKAGHCVAITGSKSSGKSTLLQIIAGIHAPSTGTVFLDDITPSAYCMSDMLGKVGYLPQLGRIFRGTILDNITGFREDETSVRAAKDAAVDLGLDSVIDFLPYGYQTLLTDTTADPIPPGIKQRIALARILMHKPSIVLFDDADRALDKEGYNKLFRLMGRLKGRCTLVIVSHDRNLLSFSDETYHLEGGQLRREASAGSQNISHLGFTREEF